MPDDEIRGGMLAWDAGSLSTTQLDRVLLDSLADLWQDSYRNDPSGLLQLGLFTDRLEQLARAATGRPDLTVSATIITKSTN